MNIQSSAPNPGSVASTSRTQLHGIPIDPALISVPDHDNSDLQDGPSIAKSHGYAPADKVAGSGEKRKQHAQDVPSHKCKQQPYFDEDLRMTKHGHPQGTANYS